MPLVSIPRRWINYSVFRIDALNRKPRQSICTSSDVFLESNARIAAVFSEYGSDSRDIPPIRCKLHEDSRRAHTRRGRNIIQYNKTRQYILVLSLERYF